MRDEELASLPGGHLVATGLRDLAQGAETVEAVLVSIDATQLRQLGFCVAFPAPNRKRSRRSPETTSSTASTSASCSSEATSNAMPS